MLAPIFWPLCLGITLALLLVPIATGRPRDALRDAWVATAFLLPCWVTFQLINSIAIDLRGVAALGGLLALAAMPTPSTPTRLRAVDYAFAAMLAGMAASELVNGSLQAGTIPAMMIDFGLPYLAGRRLLAGTSGLRPATKSLARVVAAVAALGLFEMLTKLNVADKLAGRFNYAIEVLGEGTRYGMQRSHGNTVQPISFGMCGIMLMPWAIQGAAMARDGRGPRWWRRLPALDAAAVCSSLSRGPVLMLAVCGYIYVALTRPRLRAPMAALAAAAALGLYFGQDAVVGWLAVVAEEGESGHTVLIDGQPVRYTGTRHRQLLYLAYDRALRECGPLGVGTEAVLLIPSRYRVQKPLTSIDNHFILHQLTYGPVGIWLFDLMILATLATLARVALRRGSPYATLAAGLCGAQAAVALNLFSVYLSTDFRGPWIFGVGLAASLADLDAAAAAAAAAAGRKPAATPDLPGPVSRSKPS